MDLKKVINHFIPGKPILDIQPFGKGHINSTYKVSFVNDKQEYILQKINSDVFHFPDQIVQNHIKLQRFFNKKQCEIEIPYLISTKEKKYLFFDQNGDAWRMMNFIQNAYSAEVINDEVQAFESGKAFGGFLKALSNANPVEFNEAIKGFHSLSYRIKQFKDSVDKNNAGRLNKAKGIVQFYMNKSGQLLEIEELITTNKIPTRIVHNDTKLNNLLFRENKAVAVIDLDTVGPGSVLYDYGDALRTIGNTCTEDERNPNKVDFNLDFFQSFTKGYLEQTGYLLNTEEKAFLHIAPIYMTFIIGIRFLTDYLNGDIYFKTIYEEHNLGRSKVQMKLIEQMELHLEWMKEIIKNNL